MEKMARVLTGGTGDVNPQYISIRVTQSGTNTYTEGALALPVLRSHQRSNKYQVIELLKVVMDVQAGDFQDGDNIIAQLTTTSQTSATSFSDPQLLDRVKFITGFTTSGMEIYSTPVIHDFTDGAGHGVIVAADTLYFGINTVGLSAAINADCRVYFRFKNIGVNEFVGLAITQNTS